MLWNIVSLLFLSNEIPRLKFWGSYPLLRFYEEWLFPLCCSSYFVIKWPKFSTMCSWIRMVSSQMHCRFWMLFGWQADLSCVSDWICNENVPQAIIGSVVWKACTWVSMNLHSETMQNAVEVCWLNVLVLQNSEIHTRKLSWFLTHLSDSYLLLHPC